MRVRGCPLWCVERHPSHAPVDGDEPEVWLHRSVAAQIDTRHDRAVLRSEWTSCVVDVYLATVDDPDDETDYETVVEISHGGVVLTVTAQEARELAESLAQHADLITASTPIASRRRLGRLSRDR